MSKQLFIYDVDKDFEDIFRRFEGKALLFPASPQVSHCICCFGCWIKTPGQCVIPDRCSVMPSYLAQCSEVVIVSPITYGGYSPKIKAVLDRSIGYLLPYFRIINDGMHHQMRHKNAFQLSVWFYGECDETDKDIARRLVKANAINFGAKSYTVHFYGSVEDMGEILP